MCISNETTKEILKNIRNISNLDDNELASLVAHIKVLKDELEVAEKIAKKKLIDSGYDKTLYFTEIKKKVYLSEGKSSTIYDNNKIFDSVGKDIFLEIVKVQKNLIEKQPDVIQKVIEDCTETTKGAPFITVYKMSKEELVENTNK